MRGLAGRRRSVLLAMLAGLLAVALGIVVFEAPRLIEVPRGSGHPVGHSGPGAGIGLGGVALLLLARRRRVGAILTGIAAPIVGAIQPSGSQVSDTVATATGGILTPWVIDTPGGGITLAVTPATVTLLLFGAATVLAAGLRRHRRAAQLAAGAGVLGCMVSSGDGLIRVSETPWAELGLPSTWLAVSPALAGVALCTAVVVLTIPAFRSRRSARDRHRILRLSAVLATVVSIVAGLAIVALYSVAFDRERTRVRGYAQHVAGDLAALVRPTTGTSTAAPGEIVAKAQQAILHLDRESQGAILGSKTEVLVGRRLGHSLVFLARQGRGGSRDLPSPMQMNRSLAVPMWRATSGDSGSVIGLDYGGRRVLAGYAALDGSGLGVVVKHDLSEFRAPFVRAGVFAATCAALFTIVGSSLFVKIGMPLVLHLEESERLHLLAQEIARVGHWRWAPRDGMVTGSPQFFSLLFGKGRCRRASVRRLIRAVHPQDRALLFDAARSAAQRQDRLDLEVRIRLASGAERVLSVEGRADLTGDGAAAYVVGTALDVTARTGAERDLRRAHETLEASVRERTAALVVANKRLQMTQFAVDNAADPIFWIGEDARFIYVNESACASLGYSREELLQLSVPDILPMVRLEAWPDHWDELRREGSLAIESEHRTKDGRVFPVEITATYQEFEGTAFNFVRARDISKRREARDALARSEREFRRFIETSPYAIVFSTAEGSVSHANPAARTLFGSSGDDDLGDLDIARDLYQRSEDREILLEQLRAEGGVQDLEVALKTRSGTPLTALLTASVERDEDGRFVGTRSIIRDVTTRRALEEQLRQSQKMEAVGTLAGGVAHDFNNLLVAILGYADLALDSLEEGSNVAQDVAEIRAAGQRAADLTRRLLAFSRRQEMEPRIMDVNDVVRGFENLIRRTIGEDVRLVTDLDSGLAKIRADPGQVEQILMNLAANARDAMPRGGTLTVRTVNVAGGASGDLRQGSVRRGQQVLLEVSDTGEGMDPETREWVFEPFFTTKEVDKGTGLGLSTVYGIVKQSDGSIAIDSEPDRGTTIRILLPQVDDDVTSSRPSPSSRVEIADASILLVEDHDGVRDLTARCLAKAGFDVLTASDGQEALEILTNRAHAVDLLLTDVVMPGISGPELAEEVQQRWPGTRVLFVSGYPQRDAVGGPSKPVPGEFLRKPYAASDLVEKIYATLDDRQAA